MGATKGTRADTHATVLRKVEIRNSNIGNSKLTRWCHPRESGEPDFLDSRLRGNDFGKSLVQTRSNLYTSKPMDEPKSNPLTLPVAIVIAGVLIAGAIFLRSSTGFDSSEKKQPEGKSPSVSQEELPLAPVDAARDYIRGNPNADIIFVEFSDTECPFCKRFHTTMLRVMEEYGKSGRVAWVYRQFPIPELHRKAPKESEALLCAAELGGNGKFWEYTDRIFEVTPSNDGLDPSELSRIAVLIGLDGAVFEKCLASGRYAERVQSEFKDGSAAGANGTPYSVLTLRNPVSDDDRNALTALMEPFRDPYGELPMRFSQDGLRIGLSGALPFDALKSIIETLK